MAGMDQTTSWLLAFTLGIGIASGCYVVISRYGQNQAKLTKQEAALSSQHHYLNTFTERFVSESIQKPKIPPPVDAVVDVNPFLKNIDLWSYSGRTGPAYWSDVSDDFALCQKGTKQSPINITNPKFVNNLGKIQYFYGNADIALLNTGRTLLAPVPPGAYVIFEDQRYDLTEFHFHSPSEHQVDSIAYDMEIHFVHRNDMDEFLYLGIFIDQSSRAHSELGKLWADLPKTQGQSGHATTVDLKRFIPNSPRFYRYEGSQCTPPCSENAKWLILVKTLQISGTQMDNFATLFHRNIRPLQGAMGRQVRISSGN